MFCFSLAWVRTPKHALQIMHPSAFKVTLFKKLFIFFSLRQRFKGFGDKWELLDPGREVQMEAAVIALNQKVVDKFLKVCVEGRGLASVPGHSVL